MASTRVSSLDLCTFHPPHKKNYPAARHRQITCGWEDQLRRWPLVSNPLALQRIKRRWPIQRSVIDIPLRERERYAFTAHRFDDLDCVVGILAGN